MSDGLGESPEEHADRDAASRATRAHDNLPMVVAPKLGAGDEPVDEMAAEDASAGPAARAPASSIVMLAGTVAFAAAFASFVGSVSGSSLVRYLSAPAPTPVAQTTADTAETARQIKLQLAELTALKSNIDTASRNATNQFSKISDRLDHLDQRVASVAASDATGSIAPPAPAAAAASPPASLQTAKLTDRILQDWVVADVQGGRALVESRYGGVFDVGAGSMLPGVGRVDAIKRQDGQWIVLTARGTITSGR